MPKFLQDIFSQELQETPLGIILVCLMGIFLLILIVSLIFGIDVSFLGISVNRAKDTKENYEKILKRLSSIEEIIGKIDQAFKSTDPNGVILSFKEQLDIIIDGITEDIRIEEIWDRLSDWLKKESKKKAIVRGTINKIQADSEFKYADKNQIKVIEENLLQMLTSITRSIIEDKDIDFEKEGPMKEYVKSINLDGLNPSLFSKSIGIAKEYIVEKYGHEKEELNRSEIFELDQILKYCQDDISRYLH